MSTLNIFKARAEIEDLTSQNKQLVADLAVAESMISAQEAEIKSLKEQLLKSVPQKTAEDVSKEIEAKASAKALEIVAAQGVKPVRATAPAEAGDVLTQFRAIQDPTKRQAFWKANSTALFNAWKNEPKPSR